MKDPGKCPQCSDPQPRKLTVIWIIGFFWGEGGVVTYFGNHGLHLCLAGSGRRAACMLTKPLAHLPGTACKAGLSDCNRESPGLECCRRSTRERDLQVPCERGAGCGQAQEPRFCTTSTRPARLPDSSILLGLHLWRTACPSACGDPLELPQRPQEPRDSSTSS